MHIYLSYIPQTLSQLNDAFKPLLLRVKENRDQWELLDRKQLENQEARLQEDFSLLETDI